MKDSIYYTFYDLNGKEYKKGHAASVKSLRRIKNRADLAYGAVLGSKAHWVEAQTTVYC